MNAINNRIRTNENAMIDIMAVENLKIVSQKDKEKLAQAKELV
jgi:hypothetical protein